MKPAELFSLEASWDAGHSENQHIYYVYMGREGGGPDVAIGSGCCSQLNGQLKLNGPKHLSFIHSPFLIDLLARWITWKHCCTHTHTGTHTHGHTDTGRIWANKHISYETMMQMLLFSIILHININLNFMFSLGSRAHKNEWVDKALWHNSLLKALLFYVFLSVTTYLFFLPMTTNPLFLWILLANVGHVKLIIIA